MSLSLLLLLACQTSTPPEEQDDDLDGDGYSVALGDCDDGDPSVHPLADEWCDGIDNDCDRLVDEGGALDAVDFYEDADGDGFGNPERTTKACAVPDGHAANGDDCDDDDASIYPDATEIPCDNILQSCTGPDGDRVVPTQYSTLQAAISAAAPGDTICVYEGTYEGVTIDRSLTIIGQQGAGRTEIDADDGPAMTIEAVSGVTLIGLSFTDGDALSGGGLAIQYSSEVSIEDCIFTENQAQQGGAMVVLSSERVAVKNSAFTRNRASSGGAVSVWASDEVSFEGCTFEGNAADNGGGSMNVVNSAAVTVTDGLFNNGYALEGGAIKVGSSGLSLVDVDLTNNLAGLGGGLYLDQARLDASGGTISGNSAEGTDEAEAAGGGLWAFGGSVDFSGTVFQDNSPDDAHCTSTSGC